MDVPELQHFWLVSARPIGPMVVWNAVCKRTISWWQTANHLPVVSLQQSQQNGSCRVLRPSYRKGERIFSSKKTSKSSKKHRTEQTPSERSSFTKKTRRLWNEVRTTGPGANFLGHVVFLKGPQSPPNMLHVHLDAQISFEFAYSNIQWYLFMTGPWIDGVRESDHWPNFLCLGFNIIWEIFRK